MLDVNKQVKSFDTKKIVVNIINENKDIPNEKANDLTKELYDRFVQEYGSCLCKDVQKKIFGRSFNFWNKKEKELFETSGGHIDKCPAVVAKTAQWTFKIIEEEINKSKEKRKGYEGK